jgi:hypothetical protein
VPFATATDLAPVSVSTSIPSSGGSGDSAAKSEAGIREVHVSPDLVDELVTHLDNLRRADRSTEPEAVLFPNLRGGRMSRQRAAEIVGEAAELASTRLAQRTAGVAEHDAVHAPPHLSLDRVAGEPLRRRLGDEPGRARRLEDEDGRLRPAQLVTSTSGSRD